MKMIMKMKVILSKLVYPSRLRGSLQKSSALLKIWKPMPQNIPLRKIPKRKSRNGRNSGGNCRRKPLPVWRTLPERKRILKMSSHGGTDWTLTGSAENAIMNSAAAGTIFRWNTVRQWMSSFSRTH